MRSNLKKSLKYQKFCPLLLRYLIKIIIIKISASFHDAFLHDRFLQNSSLNASGFNSTIYPHSARHSLLLSLFSSEWSVILLFVNGRFLSLPVTSDIFHSRLFVHVYFSCSNPTASLSRNALSHLHRWLSHGFVVVSRCVRPIMCRIISISKIKKSRSTHRRRNILHVSPFLPRPFDATNELRLAMNHHLFLYRPVTSCNRMNMHIIQPL